MEWILVFVLCIECGGGGKAGGMDMANRDACVRASSMLGETRDYGLNRAYCINRKTGEVVAPVIKKP